MSDLPLQEHVLHAFLNQYGNIMQDDSGVQIEIHPFLAYINLRGNPDHDEFLLAVRTVLGQDLPLVANTMSIREHNIFWLGPDEWLLITKPEKEKGIVNDLRNRLSQQFCAVTELTGGQIMLRLTGVRANDVLARGCTLDFHSSIFKPGQCAQSGLARASMLIGKTSSKPVYDIIVRRSFAEYTALWLHHAANEYGVEFLCAE